MKANIELLSLLLLLLLNTNIELLLYYKSSIPVAATRHIQKAYDTPVAATVYQKILADDTNTATDIARLKAAATLHAGD